MVCIFEDDTGVKVASAGQSKGCPYNQEEQQDLRDIRWSCHHRHSAQRCHQDTQAPLPRRMPLQAKLSPTAPRWQDWSGPLGSPSSGGQNLICVWIPPITGPGIEAMFLDTDRPVNSLAFPSSFNNFGFCFLLCHLSFTLQLGSV